MYKITTTITKKQNEQWILISEPYCSQVFTAEEIDNIIKPYYQYTRTLPGFDRDAGGFTVSGDTYTANLVFDTLENANNANVLLFVNPVDVSVLNKNKLLSDKTLQFGYKYNVTRVIT